MVISFVVIQSIVSVSSIMRGELMDYNQELCFLPEQSHPFLPLYIYIW